MLCRELFKLFRILVFARIQYKQASTYDLQRFLVEVELDVKVLVFSIYIYIYRVLYKNVYNMG